jgi:hypothetical protein
MHFTSMSFFSPRPTTFACRWVSFRQCSVFGIFSFDIVQIDPKPDPESDLHRPLLNKVIKTLKGLPHEMNLAFNDMYC